MRAITKHELDKTNKVKVMVLWNIMPHILADGYQRFEENYDLPSSEYRCKPRGEKLESYREGCVVRMMQLV